MSPSMSPFKLESGPAAPGVRAGARGLVGRGARGRPPGRGPTGVGSSRASVRRSASVAHLSLSLSVVV